MNKRRVWLDNLLLRFGLVRLSLYVQLLGRYRRLSAQYEKAMAYGNARQGSKVDAYNAAQDKR